MSVLEGERKEFEAACAKYGQEKQAVMERVRARRDMVRGVLEAGVLPAAESPARCVRPASFFRGYGLRMCDGLAGLCFWRVSNCN